MKFNRLLFIACTLLLLVGACKSKQNQQENQPEEIILDEVKCSDFALQLEQSILDGNPLVYNNAFDKEYLMSVIRDNSIVNSSLDADFGQAFFESNFHIGDETVALVDNGGDFKFVRYYLNAEDNSHHIVFRTYNDFILNFSDYVVGTDDGKIVIKDGFIYNTGCLFSDNIRENILLNVLYKTNPEGMTKILSNIKRLSNQDKNKEALDMLKEHQEELGELSCYWQLYIANLYKTCPKSNFIDSINSLKDKGLDQRMLLLHQMMFYLNEGMSEECENTISQIIEYAGDDPIFLLIFGKANYYGKNYETALGCYKTADQYLPPLWDLWYGKLECYSAMNDQENFDLCLETAKQNYGMTDEELSALKGKFHFKQK